MTTFPWYRFAACSHPDIDPNIFFPDDRTGNYNEARRICAGCPAIAACREHGIRHEEHGMWGGLTPRERRIIRRQRHLKLTKVAA